jgi:hypothetical protein
VGRSGEAGEKLEAQGKRSFVGRVAEARVWPRLRKRIAEQLTTLVRLAGKLPAGD